MSESYRKWSKYDFDGKLILVQDKLIQVERYTHLYVATEKSELNWRWVLQIVAVQLLQGQGVVQVSAKICRK